MRLLVEQMAAAAGSLKLQAQDLVRVVATFTLDSGDGLLTQAAPPALASQDAAGLVRLQGDARRCA